MKALILAGGHATRLWPVTKDRPKSLLPLGGKPILGYILDELEEVDKIGKIIVTTNEKFEENFEEYLEDRHGNYELIIEKQKSEEEKYGAIGGIINVLENRPKDDYLVIGGDNYYSFSLKKFIDFSLKKDAVTNACYKLESLEEAKNYGIVNFDSKRKITDFVEKPGDPESSMASTACYFFPEEDIELFDEYVEYWKGKIPEEDYLDETGRFIEWVVKRYDSYAYPFEGNWVDIGTKEGYLRAEREVREGNVIKGEVKDTDLGDNVTILQGSKVLNSEIENSIILRNCEIKNSVIKNSIVGEETKLRNKNLRDGLVERIELS